MVEGLPIPDELVDYLKEHDLKVKKGKASLKAIHQNIPVYLVYRFRGKNVVIELDYDEELREVLEDLVESGEDVEDLVDDVLSELRDIAIETSRMLEDKGYSCNVKLREGENDIRDIVEDVMESYSEYEFEEE